MDSKDFLDEKIIELLDRVENYANEYPGSDQQENGDIVEQSLETGIVVDRKLVEFERKTVIEGKLTIMLPIDFTKMNPDIARLKYPSEQRPQVIFTDPNNSVNFWVTRGEDFVEEKSIENLRDQVFATIQRLNPAIKIQQSGVEIVSDRKVAYVEYSNPVIDGKIYNVMVFLAIDEKVTIVCFNCITKSAKYWRNPMMEMLKSMQFTTDKRREIK